MALVLRIKFPLSYPVIYKTLRIDSSLTVRQAIQSVNETLRVNVPVDSIGLYLPHEKRWLDDNQVLSTVPELQEAVISLPILLCSDEYPFFYSRLYFLIPLDELTFFDLQEEIEFRDRTAPPEAPPKNNVEEEEDSGCCTIQ